MKAIMISVKPKWVVKILNGEKTIEVRKENVGKAVQKLIDEYGYADIYVYCTKNSKNILVKLVSLFGSTIKWVIDLKKNQYVYKTIYNGKVLFKFRCYKVEEIKFTQTEWHGTKETSALQVLDDSCLSAGKIMTYLKDKNKDKDGKGYAIQISDLEIFDKPKELNEFYTINKAKSCSKSGCPYFGTYKCKSASECSIQFQLTKAPQSFCYVEVEINE